MAEASQIQVLASQSFQELLASQHMDGDRHRDATGSLSEFSGAFGTNSHLVYSIPYRTVSRGSCPKNGLSNDSHLPNVWGRSLEHSGTTSPDSCVGDMNERGEHVPENMRNVTPNMSILHHRQI